MYRRRRFVPTMDHLGFRIAPSGLPPVAVATTVPEDDDECYIPGEGSQVAPSLTWDTPDHTNTPMIGWDDITDKDDVLVKN